MARKRKGRDISGWLVVDKPAGITSTAVVGKVRWALQARKAGHAGTLDPEATGVLAVALGGWLLYRFMSYWGRRRPDAGLEAALAGEAGQAAQALRQGDALRAVVVRCYQAMCEVLQGRQRFAAHSLTPREFEHRLGEAGIQDPLIGRLSRLFERVRYGAQSEGQNDKREALSCLEGIEQKYGEKP